MRFLLNLDMFGVTPQLLIQNERKNNTLLGTFLTFLLGFCILISCWVYGKDMHYKKHPQTTITEQITKKPKRFDITKNSFNFGVSLQGADWQHYIDESIYTVNIKQIIIKNTGKSEIIDLQARPCKNSDFQIDTEYFHNLYHLQNLYCINNYDNLYIEGDYGQEIFSEIQVNFLPCNPKTSEIECKDKKTIEKALNDNYWAIYFSDEILNPKEFENPFKKVGRSLYGVTSSNLYRQLDFYFRNQYFHDNTGIIFDNFSEKRGLQFSYEKEFIKYNPLSENNQFLQLNIRFEHFKETIVYRKYLNIAEVLANVGGILKVLMVVFMFVASMFSWQHYNLNLANDMFNFEYQNPEKPDYKSKKNNISNKEKMAFSNKKLYFKNILQSFTSIWSKKQTQEKKILYNFAAEKLNSHMNMSYILNKLIEFEKMKMLLFNEKQQKLFECIPKPLISLNIIQDLQKKKNIQDKQDTQPNIDFKIKKLDNNKNIVDSIQLNIQKNKRQHRKPKHKSDLQQNFHEILFQDIENADQKLQDAYQAYTLILQQPYKQEVDSKILKLLDKNTLNQFNSKIFGLQQYSLKESSIIQYQSKNKYNCPQNRQHINLSVSDESKSEDQQQLSVNIVPEGKIDEQIDSKRGQIDEEITNKSSCCEIDCPQQDQPNLGFKSQIDQNCLNDIKIKNLNKNQDNQNLTNTV